MYNHMTPFGPCVVIADLVNTAMNHSGKSIRHEYTIHHSNKSAAVTHSRIIVCRPFDIAELTEYCCFHHVLRQREFN